MKFKVGDVLRRVTPITTILYEIFHLSPCKTYYGVYKFYDNRKETVALSVNYVDSRFELNYASIAKKEITDWLED